MRCGGMGSFPMWSPTWFLSAHAKCSLTERALQLSIRCSDMGSIPMWSPTPQRLNRSGGHLHHGDQRIRNGWKAERAVRVFHAYQAGQRPPHRSPLGEAGSLSRSVPMAGRLNVPGSNAFLHFREQLASSDGAQRRSWCWQASVSCQ